MQTANNIQPLLSNLALYSFLSFGLSVTIWAVADKYRLWEKYDVYYSYKFGPMCMLCIGGFWVPLIYTLPIALITRNWILLLSPFITAGLTLKIAGKK